MAVRATYDSVGLTFSTFAAESNIARMLSEIVISESLKGYNV
jgi:hypothetical protein